MGASGKSIMSIDKPITSEKDDKGLTLDKEKSTFWEEVQWQNKCIATKDHCWINGKKNGEIRDKFKDGSEIRTITKYLSSIKKNNDKIIIKNGRSSNCWCL